MVNINDPATGRGAEVNPQGQLVTRAVFESELEHESSENGFAYTWDSLEIDIDTGDTMLFVKNTGDKPLHLEYAAFNGAVAIVTWTILVGALTTTPAGTDVVGVNMNRIFASQPARASAFSDETAVADGTVIGRIKTGIDGHHVHPMAGVILGNGDYVQFNQITESIRGSVLLVGHFVPA